jgi:hypothetical protein
MKKVHQAEKQTCEICSREFPNLLKYQSHKRRIHTEWKHKCEYEGCGKKFYHRNQLVMHIDSQHLGVKKENCHICGENFLKR